MRYAPPIHLTVSTIFLFLSVLVTPPAQAQEAFFSFQGEIVNPGDSVAVRLINFRDVGAPENISFRGWTHSGGTNAAGDNIAASGFDGSLGFFNFVQAPAVNLDGGNGLDPWLTFPGIAMGGGTLPTTVDQNTDMSNPPFLTIQGQNNSTGPFAVDIVAPVDAFAVLGPASVNGTPRLESLSFGTTGSGDIAALYLVGPNAVNEFSGRVEVGKSGNAILGIPDTRSFTCEDLDVGFGGIIQVEGTLTCEDDLIIRNSGGIDFVQDGTLTVNDGMDINGGVFVAPERGTFNLNGDLFVFGGGLFSTNQGNPLFLNSLLVVTEVGSRLETTGDLFSILGDQQFRIQNLGDWTHDGNLLVGVGNLDGTLDVRSGATLDVNGVLSLALGGGRGVVDIVSNAEAECGDLLLGSGAIAGTLSELNINSGGSMTVARSVEIANDPGSLGISRINVEGNGSSFTQSSSENGFILGNAADTPGNGTHQINVTENAVFTTNFTTINRSGSLNINTGGEFIDQGNFVTSGRIRYGLESPSSFEGIQVTGTATLDGDVTVDIPASFTPTNGQIFELLRADGGVNGEFENVTLNFAPDGFLYEIVYTPNTVQIVATLDIVLGDADENGVVNFLDIAPFIGLLTSGNFLAQADIDRNGMVDFNDIAPFINLLSVGGP